VLDLDAQFLDHFEVYDPDRQPGSGLIKIFSLREKDAAQCFHFAAPSTEIARRWLATVNPAPSSSLAELQAENDRLQREFLELENARLRHEVVEIRASGTVGNVPGSVDADHFVDPALVQYSFPRSSTAGLEVGGLDSDDNDDDIRNRGLISLPDRVNRAAVFVALLLEVVALVFPLLALPRYGPIVMLLNFSWFALPVLVGLAAVQAWTLRSRTEATLSRRDRDGAIATVVFIAIVPPMFLLQIVLVQLIPLWANLTYGALVLVAMLAHLWHAVQLLRFAPHRVPDFEHVHGAPARVLFPSGRLRWLRLAGKATIPLTIVAFFALAGAWREQSKAIACRDQKTYCPGPALFDNLFFRYLEIAPMVVLSIAAMLATVASHMDTWDIHCSRVAVSGVVFSAIVTHYLFLLLVLLIMVAMAFSSQTTSNSSFVVPWGGLIVAHVFAFLVALYTGILSWLTYAATDRAVDGPAGVRRGRERGCCAA
jgi:hypothetical protein